MGVEVGILVAPVLVAAAPEFQRLEGQPSAQSRVREACKGAAVEEGPRASPERMGYFSEEAVAAQAIALLQVEVLFLEGAAVVAGAAAVRVRPFLEAQEDSVDQVAASSAGPGNSRVAGGAGRLVTTASGGLAGEASSSSRRFNSRLKLDGRDGKSPRAINFRNLPGPELWHHWSLEPCIEHPDFHHGRTGHMGESWIWN